MAKVRFQFSRISPMSSRVFPSALKPGSTIGIIAPSRAANPEWTKKGKAFLEKNGYRVVLHPQLKLKDGQLGGSDAQRAKAIMDMFKDKKIDAIMCARGGTGAIRLLDKLDYKLIKKNPKPFIGFSDITNLLQAINRKCGFPTFHGPLLWNFAHDYDKRTATDFLSLLQNQNKEFTQYFSKVDVVRAGNAKGILTGGNITMLQRLIGTPYEWPSKGSILFIEDVDEVIYKLAEKLQHMKLAGKFTGLRAVIVGEMVDIADGESGFARPGEKPYGHSFREILMDLLPSNIPVCFNFPCGHGKFLTTLPVGASAKLVLNSKGAELTITQA